ncbi:phage tail protein [Alkanindiges illinoisensis]|uniref:Phage tail protein n=1 Tax=Alkanindiges illinoisensis TaxID=197183 RepID=A0A4Y7X8Q4_9GAMM|nr:phage tail protein [Alkanindiges illinoisensis]TEU23320.1 phage tail protein [Alkanindiges illinoisensis]
MPNKIVYQLNITGLFVGETLADESPMEPGIFLIPAGCVELAPPESWPEDQWPRWNGFEWELIQKPRVPEAVSAEAKLAEFLSQNPDVLQLIQKN